MRSTKGPCFRISAVILMAATGLLVPATGAGAGSPVGPPPGHAGAPDAALPPLTLEIEQSGYGAGEPVVVTIVNHSPYDLEAYDHRTFCTVVTLERRADGREWRPLRNCRSTRPARLESLAAGVSRRISLGPGSSRPASNLPPGRYRAVVVYRPAGSQSAATERRAVSDDFRVGRAR